MKKLWSLIFILSLYTQVFAQPRTQINFNNNWKFKLGDEPEAKNITFNDDAWRKLNLPHDWSIEADFAKENPATNQGGALPGGIAWYRKTFKTPANTQNKVVYIQFDGIYQHSEVWINGVFLGKRPNGYISFQYDITPHLKSVNQENIIAVRVNNSEQPNSRWYSGSGIYRNVKLLITNPIAIAQHGVFVTTPQVSANEATLKHQLQLENTSTLKSPLEVEVKVLNAKGKLVARNIQTVPVNQLSGIITQNLNVKNPALWSPQTPYLYQVITKVYQNKVLVDELKTSTGIRSFRFDVKNGFYLNDVPTKILGVCLHHDLGAIGATVNVRAMERQLEMLKAMGTNAIRTAHNPPAPEFLDLCDKMGFLVMDEAFDMWKKRKNKFDYHRDFEEWHERDLADLVKRDRNHPSVFMWSIGNEIREQFDSTGTKIAANLSKIVKLHDNTRPVTTALTETEPAKNFIWKSNALDVLGFNYKYFDYDSLPKRFGDIPLIAAETTSALQTRGVYDLADTLRLWPASSKDKFVVNGNPDYTVTAYDNVAAYWGTSHEKAWKAVKDRNFMSGIFVWTGFDYLGEPVPYDFPARSSYYGIIDLAGFPKDVYYMYQSEWTNQPVLHLLPHWNWQAGKVVDVWAYYNQADEVELFLNGKSLGKKAKTTDELHVSWKVPFEAGTLKAISYLNGKVVLEKEIRTAGAPHHIVLNVDRNKLKADGNDLAFVTATLVDEAGTIIPDADNLIKFTISGAGQIAGTDNGYQADLSSLSKPNRKLWKGKALAIVKASQHAGKIVLTAEADGFKPVSINIKTK
ncbi:beta-galactosidase BoGH2A [Pedobacter glucosidilyticus]|nr:glycoside hydrolase family 2 TIM barrel-domain containing protein [Pedobacter glucosidilyticus]KHJ39306.1 beta-galactosidase BoGH2A [Pedobacter glucosidilyticus]